MQNWLISANGNIYDHVSSFAKNGYIDWKQNKFNYEINDIVYIYSTRPIKRVMFKAVVEKVKMPFSECTDDREFWIDLEEYEKAKKGNYVRLKFVEQAYRDELSLENLQQHGLKNAPQGAMRIGEELVKYIEHYLHDDYSEGFFLESDDMEDVYEGAVKTAKVNKYERSSVARKKCIEYPI